MTLSVLISVYARENPDFLRKSLESLADQTRPADEVVLVEDGPIGDDLLAVIAEFSGSLGLRSVRLGRNLGLGAALNRGLVECTHPLVARMDADDIALPDRFEIQLGYFAADPDLAILSGYAVEINADDNRGRVRIVPTTHEAIIATLWANPIIHPAVMYRRDAVLAVGSYSPALLRRQDYELWFRCAAAGFKFGNVPQPLIAYRFTPETHKRQSRRDMWRQGMIGFKGARAVGLPFWKRLACFAPFCRSLLPMPLQHLAYRLMQRIDPRASGHSKSG